MALGRVDGIPEGCDVGRDIGDFGSVVGNKVGAEDGIDDGIRVGVGRLVGNASVPKRRRFPCGFGACCRRRKCSWKSRWCMLRSSYRFGCRN